MSNIFIGMLFVFLEFNLDFNLVRVGLIPSFIGYMLIRKGLNELLDYSDRFHSAKSLATFMTVYTLLFYIANLFGAWQAMEGLIGLVLGLISTIVGLIMTYNIIMGIKDIEAIQERELATAPLYKAWRLQVIFAPLILIFTVLMPAVAVICIVISFCVGVYYLYAFNRTKNLYYEMV